MRKLYLIVLLLFAAAVVYGETYDTTIAVTDTSKLVTFDGPRANISFYNCSDGSTPTCSGSSAYFRLWSCNDQATGSIAAATTATGTPLASGESVAYTWTPNSTQPAPYCAVTIIAATGLTATVRVIGQ